MKITPNPHFDMLLEYGELREQAFARVLMDATVERIALEHKSEPHALEHGAVFIEYADHGTPTGLAITTADFYAIEVSPGRWFVLPTAELRRLCEETGRRVSGGWENRSEGYRLPLVRLLRP